MNNPSLREIFPLRSSAFRWSSIDRDLLFPQDRLKAELRTFARIFLVAGVLVACIGCGRAKPSEPEYAPKIYAVEQQEKAADALRKDNLAGALDFASKAIAHDPEYPEAYVTKATALARLGQRQAARDLLTQCLQHRADHADANLFRGVLNDELKDGDAAREDYKHAAAAYSTLLTAKPDDLDHELKYAVAEYLRAGTPGLRLINALSTKYPESVPVRFVRDRMVAQDRAFAFRWITGQPPAE